MPIDQPSKPPHGSVLARISIAFVIGGAVLAVITTFIAVYGLGWYDAKFRNALNSALQVELIGIAISFVIASTLFIVVLLLHARSTKLSNTSAVLAFMLGGGFPVGLLLVNRGLSLLDPESVVVTFAAWGYVLLYPLLAVFVMKRLQAWARARPM